MLIKDILNEYEIDAVDTILENKQLHKEFLKEKRIVCLGSDAKSLTRAIICSFLVLNDRYMKNVDVYYIESDKRKLDEALPEALYTRPDLHRITEKEISSLPAVDYIIDPGFCNKKVDEKQVQDRQKIVSEVLSLVKDKGLKKVVYLSDYRSYGKVPTGVILSEMEYKSLQPDNLIRKYESYCIEEAAQDNIPYVVLRSAIVLGAEDSDSHRVHELLELCAARVNITMYLNPDKYTFVYISDLLGAIQYTMAHSLKNEIYNVAGELGTVTNFELARILSENIEDQEKLNFIHGKTEMDEPIALDYAKLLLAGYRSLTSFSDGFEIALKAKLNYAPFFLFHDTYNGKLSAIQQLMLQVLLEIDCICKHHNIKYFLGGGTLLGAIRHKGFIPWDDDADIMMLREDYEKFTAIATQELPDYLQLQTAKTDKNNHFFSKIRIKETVCATKFTKQLSDINVGLFVDIFPHDYTANSRWGQKIHENMTIVARSLVYNKWGATYVKSDGSHKFYRLMATVIKDIMPMKFLEWQQFAIIEFFKYRKNRRFLYDGMGQNLRKGPFPKEWLEQTIYVPFETIELPVPKNYHQYLTHLYGDYMQMVGVSKRKNSHNIYLLDLGPYMEKMDINN